MTEPLIKFIAIPNGVLDNATVQLSLYVSIQPDSSGQQGAFPKYLTDWPEEIRRASFSVQVDSEQPLSIKRKVNPTDPLDSELWKKIVTARDYTIPQTVRTLNRQGTTIFKYPTFEVKKIAENNYYELAINKGIAKGNDKLRKPSTDTEQEIKNFFIRRPIPGSLPKGNKEVRRTIDFYQIFSALTDYPYLLRKLGLLIDFEIPISKNHPPGTIAVTANIPQAISVKTKFVLGAETFLPDANNTTNNVPLKDGFLDLSDPRFQVSSFDLDSVAMQMIQSTTATELAQEHDGNREPELPGHLRTTGVWLIDNARKQYVEKRLDDAHNLQTKALDARSRGVTVIDEPLYAQDLLAGFRVDVLHEQGFWQSLCRRDGTYVVDYETLPHHIDEGWIATAMTGTALQKGASGSSPDEQKKWLHEALFKWEGWSLSVTRPGASKGSQNHLFPFQVTFDPLQYKAGDSVERLLPKLRFGMHSRLRARAVFIGGIGLSGDVRSETGSQPFDYLRFDPVAAPTILFREVPSAEDRPGESLDHLVIRSGDDDKNQTAERHLLPPPITQHMAEWQGSFDGLGAIDSFDIFKDRGKFEAGKFKDHDSGSVAELPYLPDPLATGITIELLDQDDNPVTYLNGNDEKKSGPIITRFNNEWPNPSPIRLCLQASNSEIEIHDEILTKNLLTIALPQAECLKLRVSCNFGTDTTKHMQRLQKMGIWDLIGQQKPANIEALRKDALSGHNPMLTPHRDLLLVHAVQHPLIEPRFTNLTLGRYPGSKDVLVQDIINVDGKSTEKIDVLVQTDGGNAVPVQPSTLVAENDKVIDLVREQKFVGTKFQKVAYSLVATSRFHGYFKKQISSDAGKISITSTPSVASILNSAPPPPLTIDYVMPLFKWTRSYKPTDYYSKRNTNSIRVYLDTEMNLTGDGELIGVVTWPHDISEIKGFEDLLSLMCFDPLWPVESGTNINCYLRPDAIGNAIRYESILLQETTDRKTHLPVTIACVEHQLTPEGKYYVDIEINDPMPGYFPFVRINLVRLQPNSIIDTEQSTYDTRISTVSAAQFSQLPTERWVSVVRRSERFFSISIGRPNSSHPMEPATATLVRQISTDFGNGWERFGVPAKLQALPDREPVILWQGEIAVPENVDLASTKILIEQFEGIPRDDTSEPALRPVFLEIVDISKIK